MVNRITYHQEFKLEAVSLSMKERLSRASMACELGIRHSLLHRWRKELLSDETETFPGLGRRKAA